MPKTPSEPVIYAFRTEYNGIPRELVTPCQVAVARVIWDAENPGAKGRRLEDGFVRVDAIWDTGATTTNISSELATRLGLVPTGYRDVYYPSSKKPVEQKEYTVDLFLPNNLCFANHSVVEGSINDEGTNIHILIGMDIIAAGDFSLSTHAGKMHLTFAIPPCENRVDLLDRANKRNLRNGYKIAKHTW